jgi:dephospho-CoA kinase
MAEPANKISVPKINSLKTDNSMIEIIKGRQTEELIIALCGAVGSGTSTIAEEIEKIFKEFGYKVCPIKISGLIDRNRHHVLEELRKDIFLKETYISKFDHSSDLKKLDPGDRIALLQSTGNHLRKKASEDILAQLAIKEIALKRDKEENPDDKEENSSRESRRHVTIIDSLKNPKEVELLQLVYRDMFFLFGVLCPEDIREDRLKKKKIDPTKVVQLIRRDKSEGEGYGQQFLKTIFHSDFFITNSVENFDTLRPNLERFIKIIMGDKSIYTDKGRKCNVSRSICSS